VAADRNTVILQAEEDTTEFPTALPARLVGLIDAPEFVASIQRINDVKRRGRTYKLFVCTIATGCLLMAISSCFLFVHHTLARNVGLGVFMGVGFILSCFGMWLMIKDSQQRRRAARQQVAMEQARYNIAGRTPMRWRIRSEEVPISPFPIYFEDGRRRMRTRKWITRLYITVPPQQPQQSSQPLQQAQQPQPQPLSLLQPVPLQQLQSPESLGAVHSALFPQPMAAQPNSSGASAPLPSVIIVHAAPPSQFPQPHDVAPPLPPPPQPQPQHAQVANGQEGQPQQPHSPPQGHHCALGQQLSSLSVSHVILPPPGGCAVSATDSPPSDPLQGGEEVGNCERCGRKAYAAEDRFCSACGGNIRRQA
jgi:hypothetical protein